MFMAGAHRLACEGRSWRMSTPEWAKSSAGDEYYLSIAVLTFIVYYHDIHHYH